MPDKRFKLPAVRTFVENITAEAKMMGVKIHLRPTRTVVADGSHTSGYFNGDDKTSPGLAIVCAMDRDDALEILVHEYAHFCQWADTTSLWYPEMSGNLMIGFLEGKLSLTKEVEKEIRWTQKLELDCEKRVIRLVNEHGLPIKKDDYIRSANSYVLFYLWMMETGRWYRKNNPPYDNERLLAACSSTFSMNYDRLTRRLRKIFQEEDI